MTEPLILFSHIAAAGVRTAVYLTLLPRLLPAGNPGKKGAATALSGAALLCGALYLAGLPEFCLLAAEAVWIALCAARFQGAPVRMSLFVGIFYETAVALWQFLAEAWAGVLFCSQAFLDSGTIQGQAALWLLHVLLMIAVLYPGKHPGRGRTEAFRLGTGILVAGFLAVVTLSQQTVLSIAEDTLDMWTVLSVILMMSVLVFRINRQYEVEKELARLKSQQAALLERDYTALNQAYAVNARLFHDFHNHIGALRRLLSHEKLQEAIQYLDQLQAPLQELTDTVWTGDETVDYLINTKTQAARAKEIPFHTEVEFPRRTNLESADLCAILGNLLDNALEAAIKTPEEEERFIRLTIRRINQMLVIKVENSFCVPPIQKDGALVSSKEENGLHGWGLKSARTAAEKYDGTLLTSYTGQTFQAVATLCYQGADIP